MHPRRLESWTAEIAAWQYGVIALHQLARIGLSESAVRSRVAQGRLHRVERGVYSLAPPRLLSPSGWAMAAVLTAGSPALLSHAWAAWWWGLRKRPGGRVHVTRPGRGVRGRRTLVVHAAANLAPAPFTRSGGEKALHRIIRDSGLPRPLVNVPLLGYERDFWWPEQRLVVEYDGWDGHKTRAQQETDRCATRP